MKLTLPPITPGDWRAVKAANGTLVRASGVETVARAVTPDDARAIAAVPALLRALEPFAALWLPSDADLELSDTGKDDYTIRREFVTNARAALTLAGCTLSP